MNIARFVWRRISENTSGDAIWNAYHEHSGASVDITNADLVGDTSFICQFYNESGTQILSEQNFLNNLIFTNMAILSQQTFTIRRLIDGKTLNFLLQSNQALTQVYTPDPATFMPNYPTSPFLVITPSLLISGEAVDQIANLKAAPTWKINGSSTLSTFTATAATSSPYALTIKKNMADVAQMVITCEAIYVQPVTLIEMAVKATITFTKVSNNGASIIAICSAPLGTIFKKRHGFNTRSKS